MTHSQRKSLIKLRSYDHFREIILINFPDLQHKIFIYKHVTVYDIDYLINLCGYKDERFKNCKIKEIEPLINYMVDNKHMYDWWCL